MPTNKQLQSQEKPTYQPVFYTIWQDVWTALTRPRQYVEWALQPFSRTVTYLFFIAAFMAAVSTIFFYLNIRPEIVGLRDRARSAVPAVSYQDGLLSIEDDKPFTFTDSDEFFFKIDVTQSLAENPAIDSFYEVGILLTSDGAVFRTGTETESLVYQELWGGNFGFDGDSVDTFIDILLKLAIVIIPVLVICYTLLAKLLYSAIFAFIYWMFAGFKLNFVHLWSIAVYALTPAIAVGYFAFVFYPILGLHTMVFLIYMALAVSHYNRFISLSSRIYDDIKNSNQ